MFVSFMYDYHNTTSYIISSYASYYLKRERECVHILIYLNASYFLVFSQFFFFLYFLTFILIFFDDDGVDDRKYHAYSNFCFNICNGMTVCISKYQDQTVYTIFDTGAFYAILPQFSSPTIAHLISL